MAKYIIEKRELPVEKYNVGNMWDSGIPPADYDIIPVTFDKYIDLFHSSYHTINFIDQPWLSEAHQIGMITGTFPVSFNSELEKLEDVSFKESFCRGPKFSLKTGCYGPGPYKNVKMIVQSMVTTTYNHSGLSQKIFLLPWRNLDKYREMRVFVYQNKITCISPQKWASENLYFENKSDEEIGMFLDQLVTYFQKNVVKKISNLTCDYVLDLGFDIDENDFYFIEINPWGKLYGSGSAMFHWIDDEKILNGENDSITFRFCNSRQYF